MRYASAVNHYIYERQPTTWKEFTTKNKMEKAFHSPPIIIILIINWPQLRTDDS